MFKVLQVYKISKLRYKHFQKKSTKTTNISVINQIYIKYFD